MSLGIEEAQRLFDMSKEILETILTHIEVHYPYLIKLLPSKKEIDFLIQRMANFHLFLAYHIRYPENMCT